MIYNISLKTKNLIIIIFIVFTIILTIKFNCSIVHCSSEYQHLSPLEIKNLLPTKLKPYPFNYNEITGLFEYYSHRQYCWLFYDIQTTDIFLFNPWTDNTYILDKTPNEWILIEPGILSNIPDLLVYSFTYSMLLWCSAGALIQFVDLFF